MRLTRPSFRARAGTALLVACGTIVVVTLGTLQYRWNQQATEATAVRLADALQLSMVNWHLDLFRNLAEICVTLRASAAEDVAEYRDQVADWRRIARYPGLVAGVYVVDRSAIREMPPSEDRSSARALPAGLDRLVADLRRQPAAARQTDRRVADSFYDIGAALREWRFDAEMPALVRTLTPERWLVVALDEGVLSRRIFPDLAWRYFQGTDSLDYEVAVVSGTDQPRPIYTSDPGFGDRPVDDADGRLNVFADRGGVIEVFHRRVGSRGPTAAVGIGWFPLLRSGPEWQLVVRHRRGGPLGAFVEQMRQRGLAISFGALLLLVVSMSLVAVTAARAHRLGRLQMDFVTAVSHELRTPLTIIGSAADNLAAGVVESDEQRREYGAVIGAEVGQLTTLVERILLFASAREGKQRYALEPLAIGPIVSAVLASTSALIRAAQFEIDARIPDDSVCVIADRLALSQCLENLITNAVKYGKDGRWIGIAVRGEGASVEVVVQDRGAGIDPGDLPHIFEPFYRGRAERSAPAHGTGLGLALARQMAEAMNGSLVARNRASGGAEFVLSLPAAAGLPQPAIADHS